MKKILFILLILLSSVSAISADTLNLRTRREVSGLVAFIRTSPCRFQRNGGWYSSAEAAEHINRKYQYVLKKGLVHSAEDFIRYAATKSSLTGRPYQVRCEGSGLIASADWLAAQLRHLREN